MGTRLRWLSIASVVLAGGCHLITDPPVPADPRVFARDGITNGNGVALSVTVDGWHEPGIVAVSLTTWPELELVRSSTRSDATSGSSIEYTVEPESPLDARWYALVVDVRPGARVSVAAESHALVDGGFAFRFFGTSSPRIGRATIETHPSGSTVRLSLTEDVELASVAVATDVQVDGSGCEYEGGGPSLLVFTCTVLDPERARVEILTPIPSPGGAPLPPQVIEVPRTGGYRSPIG